MPLPFFFSSDGLGAMFGAAFTRFRGLTLSGSIGSTAGPNEPPAGFALVQPARVTTVAPGVAAQLVSTAAAAVSAANYMYISQSTGAVSTSSFAAAESAPPQTAMGAAIHFNAGVKKIAIYSTATGSGTWFYSAAMTSSQ